MHSISAADIDSAACPAPVAAPAAAADHMGPRGAHGSQIDNPQKTELTRCCIADVRRVLGISSGGDAALMAVAHLAGGDYDMGGADNVGETLALQAVRQLLADCEVRCASHCNRGVHRGQQQVWRAVRGACAGLQNLCG
jgi:hypothetical protein